MKKFLSTILAVVMVLSSMAMVVSADEALADGIYVGTTMYDSFTAAQTAAAATTAKEIIISGTVEFGSRQGISVDGIHLRGINEAKIIPSESFGSTTSNTNWKGLLNIAGDDVVVSDIIFDGSVYGNKITKTTDFVPLRCAEGEITLENVTITGSPRTLMNVGSTTTSAIVHANGLYCEAPLKDVPRASLVSSWTVYADVNVVNGTLNLNDGVVNGFICEDSGSGYSGSFVKGEDLTGHHTLTHKLSLFSTKEITSTVKHYAASYVNAKATSSSYVGTFKDAIADTDNQTVVAAMVNEADDYTDATVIGNFVTLLSDAKSGADTTYAETIQGYINTLNAQIATLNGGNN